MIDSSLRIVFISYLQIANQGHSRIPVYKNGIQNVLGIMLTKSLLFVDMDNAPPISDFELREIPSVSMNGDLFRLLNMFQTGKSK